jgi:hypothetical protein
MSRPSDECRLTRRQLIVGAAAAFGGLALAPELLRAADSYYMLPQPARTALGESPLVYVSPLHRDGRESSCHGEVWFFVDGGSVVVVTAAEGWKVKAVGSGRDRARLWVGDFGLVKRAGERFRSAPTFLARAAIDRDPKLFARLLDAFGERYASEWGKWKPRFEKGYADGSRVVLRYTPIGG